MIDHSLECIRKNGPLQTARLTWLHQWPNHCKACEGAGELHWTENQSPFGSGENWPMEMGDICGCIESNTCPRCGLINPLWELVDWEATPGVICIYCDWHEETPDVCPPGPDYPCECMEAEMEASRSWYEKNYPDYNEP